MFFASLMALNFIRPIGGSRVYRAIVLSGMLASLLVVVGFALLTILMVFDVRIPRVFLRVPDKVREKLRAGGTYRKLLNIGIASAALFLIGFGLLRIPELMVDRYGSTAEPLKRAEYTRLVDDYRKTLAQILAGAALLVGLIVTWKQYRLAKEGHITDRFTRAIDQLGAVDAQGHKRLEVRLGGIYALGRIAKESLKDHWQVMEVLTAYVRQNSSWIDGEKRVQPRPEADIQAILDVLNQDNWFRETRKIHRLNLSGTDLRGARMRGIHLEMADLSEAHMEGADLTGVHL